VIVTLVPLNLGGLARLREVFSTGWAATPNQYSGRYIRYWKSKLLMSLLYVLLVHGKMYVGGADGGSANTAVPLTGVVPDDEGLLLLEHPAATRAHASAAVPTARILVRGLNLNLPRCRGDLPMVAAP
jgi:hypothetical protein